MHVGDTDRGVQIHLCNLNEWLLLIERTNENVNPNDVFDAYCVFNYLAVRFKERKDPFLNKTISRIDEYEKWLVKNNFWFQIRHIRKIIISPQLVVIGRRLATREFR